MYMYLYGMKKECICIYIYIYISSQNHKGRTAPKASAAMAPASSVQSSEKAAKWEFADSLQVEDQGSHRSGSSQSPEDELEVQDKTEELFWRTQRAEFF